MAALFFWTTSVLAHRPIFSDLAANDPNTAILVDRPVVSQVIYRPLDADHRQVWLAFEARAGFDLFIELVVSVLDRLKNYRPSMAVVGLGLEQADVLCPSQSMSYNMLPTHPVSAKIPLYRY